MEKVDGIMYCHRHDDFAIEGHDWSEVCHEAHQQSSPTECVLTAMFTEPRPDQ